jgi:hypothetical protein
MPIGQMRGPRNLSAGYLQVVGLCQRAPSPGLRPTSPPRGEAF